MHVSLDSKRPGICWPHARPSATFIDEDPVRTP
jgi:hypothetical protein